MHYLPESVLINNIYLPFYFESKKIQLNAEDNLSIETGLNGLESVINIADKEKAIVPFLDMSRYDSETKDWFWYDEEGLPMRILRLGTGWALTPIYSVSINYGKYLEFNPNNLQREDNGKLLGWYSLITAIDYTPVVGTVKAYCGYPIIVSVGNVALKDRTDYSNFNTDINLTNYQEEINREFYYNTQLNKIFTNQNLTSSALNSIQIFCFQNIDSVKVKSVLCGNAGMNNYITPTVDYYIVKLHGQYLKG